MRNINTCLEDGKQVEEQVAELRKLKAQQRQMQMKSMLVCPVEVGDSETRGSRYHTTGGVKKS